MNFISTTNWRHTDQPIKRRRFAKCLISWLTAYLGLVGRALEFLVHIGLRLGFGLGLGLQGQGQFWAVHRQCIRYSVYIMCVYCMCVRTHATSTGQVIVQRAINVQWSTRLPSITCRSMYSGSSKSQTRGLVTDTATDTALQYTIYTYPYRPIHGYFVMSFPYSNGTGFVDPIRLYP